MPMWFFKVACKLVEQAYMISEIWSRVYTIAYIMLPTILVYGIFYIKNISWSISWACLIESSKCCAIGVLTGFTVSIPNLFNTSNKFNVFITNKHIIYILHPIYYILAYLLIIYTYVKTAPTEVIIQHMRVKSFIPLLRELF